jgi:uncharacterized membrane protein
MEEVKVRSQYTVYVVGLILAISYVFYNYNQKNKVPDDVAAKEGEYSDSTNYQNITPMKHDIFKQLTIDIVIVFTIYFVVEVLGRRATYFEWDDFLSFKNFRKFRLSILGQSLMSVAGYGVFYQIIQPYFVNRLPK